MQELSHYNFKLDELEIYISEIEKYAHIPENMPSYHSFLKQEIANLNSVASIEGGYVITTATVNKEKLEVGNKIFYVGTQVNQFYEGLSHVALFLCSAGSEITDRASELVHKGDLVEGYLLDVLGSVLVEKAMDKIHDNLSTNMREKKLSISNRYSPGYCDWNVKEQKQLFDFFPKNFCNVTLSDSCLMLPAKTVSGIIGIGKNVKYHKHVCHLCNSVNCIYRNSKNTK